VLNLIWKVSHWVLLRVLRWIARFNYIKRLLSHSQQ
jgi:hypothetical protein